MAAASSACIACEGSGKLLNGPCPLCEGDSRYCSNDEGNLSNISIKWEVYLGNWVRYDAAMEELIFETETAGQTTVEYPARGQDYVIDLEALAQINKRTGVRRDIRRRELSDSDMAGFEEVKEAPSIPRTKRLARLVDVLLSPAVQVQIPCEAVEETGRLSAEEFSKVFVTHVPGVQSLLYRPMPG